MTNEYRLTTMDNPFDPFTQFVDWYLFDVEKGYNTCSYIARIAEIEDDYSQEEINKAAEQAIDKIIKYDFMNIYKKVTRTAASA